MKILSIPLSYFITAIIAGIALSFLLASTVFAPHVVDTHPQEVTPVPTPKEVYVYVHEDSQADTNSGTGDEDHGGLLELNTNELSFEEMVIFLIVMILGWVAIFLPIVLTWVD